MKTIKKESQISFSCPLSKWRIYSGENNEVKVIKTYSGDWGDWDEVADNTTVIICETDISDQDNSLSL